MAKTTTTATKEKGKTAPATTELSFHEKMMTVRATLKAPKNRYNRFGKYRYRDAEGIQEAVKPLLLEYGLTMKITDEMVHIGDRYYIKATVLVTDGDKTELVTGYAREAASQKGMDEMQLTGATSSYARKYALNGMFLIDDTKDSDSTNTHGHDDPNEVPEADVPEEAPAKPAEAEGSGKPELSPKHTKWAAAKKAFKAGEVTISQIKEVYYISEENMEEFKK